MSEPLALRGSTGSHLFAIHSSQLKLRGEQPNGYYSCQIENLFLSSMMTPGC
jgi:hypothetical protein